MCVVCVCVGGGGGGNSGTPPALLLLLFLNGVKLTCFCCCCLHVYTCFLFEINVWTTSNTVLFIPDYFPPSNIEMHQLQYNCCLFFSLLRFLTLIWLC